MTSAAPTRVRLVLLAFLLSGSAALIYEVAWTRALSLVLGSTTYAVSTMLATFMAGLALGAWLGGRLADRGGNLLRLFGLCELGIGVTGLVSLPLIYGLPRFYLGVYRSFHLYPPVFFALQILLCAVVMAVPTTLMGATFPLVSRAVTGNIGELGRRVGSAYSFNTVGAVIGAVGAGFLLIPVLGMKGAVLVAGSVNLVVGIGMVLGSRAAKPALLAAFIAAYLPAALWTLAADRHVSLVSFYSAHRFLGAESYDRIHTATRSQLEPVYEASFAEGEVRAFRDPAGHLVLEVGGKIEGTGPKDIANTHLLAYLPIAARPAPESMLVVGLGAGVTLAASRPHVPDVDVVEINPGVVEAVKRFGPSGALDGVDTILDDARSYLAKTDRRYDVISSEPSYPSESVVANLFTREFFRLVATRLEAGGVYAQWLPYHILTNDAVTMMIRTFATVFPHALLFKAPDGLDLILVGSREPLAFGPDELMRRVDALNTERVPLRYVLSRDSEAIAEIAGRTDVPVNTDDHPILEFRVARNLLVGDIGRLEREEAGRPGPGAEAELPTGGEVR
jgi:spermidine synthase